MKYGLALAGDTNGACRVKAHDELLYSLRSVEKYASWINKIFILVDDIATLPAWLNVSNPKLRIVRLSEFIPCEYLPCFCSPTIEHHIAFISDLSEHFLYANDDMFFGAPVNPDFFFGTDSKPIVRVDGHFRKRTGELSNYVKTFYTSSDLVIENHPGLPSTERENIYLYPHHNIDAYCKSDCLNTYNKYKDRLLPTFSFPFRADNQYQRSLYLCEAVASGLAHLKILHKDMNLVVDSLNKSGESSKESLHSLWSNAPSLFVLNDNSKQTEGDYHAMGAFLELKFPDSSSFELN